MKKFYDQCVFFAALTIEPLCNFLEFSLMANEQQVYHGLQLV